MLLILFFSSILSSCLVPSVPLFPVFEPRWFLSLTISISLSLIPYRVIHSEIPFFKHLAGLCLSLLHFNGFLSLNTTHSPFSLSPSHPFSSWSTISLGPLVSPSVSPKWQNLSSLSLFLSFLIDESTLSMLSGFKPSLNPKSLSLSLHWSFLSQSTLCLCLLGCRPLSPKLSLSLTCPSWPQK